MVRYDFFFTGVDFDQIEIISHEMPPLQVVYILDQVRALENEMLLRIKRQGLHITPRILIVRLELD